MTTGKSEGRELDALVATKIFKHTIAETDDCNGEDNFWIADAMAERRDWIGLPNYSTDISDAWTVVEKMRERAEAWEFNIESNLGKWKAGFFSNGEYFDSDWEETASLAICRAALRAVGGEA
jgi:hypothetical protein